MWAEWGSWPCVRPFFAPCWTPRGRYERKVDAQVDPRPADRRGLERLLGVRRGRCRRHRGRRGNRTYLAELRRSGGYETLLKHHPLGTLGEPEDVAYAAVYLASDEARWVTGVALPVDGGMSAGVR